MHCKKTGDYMFMKRKLARKAEKMNKKGVSPLIATTMLVGFTVAVIGLVIVWSRGYIEETAQKQEALANTKLMCENVNFEVPSTMQLGENIDVSIKNLASQKIDAFVLRIKGCNDAVESTEQFFPVKGLETAKIGGEQGVGSESFSIDALGGTVKTIEIIPELKAGKNKYVPCSSKMLEARVAESC